MDSLITAAARALAAGDILGALNRVALRDDPPDIIISDLGLPDMDGYELIRRIRAIDPPRTGAIPAIAVTAYARAEDRARVSFRRVLQVAPDSVRVVEPRYQGIDQQERPFNVTADVATQNGGRQEVVELDRPRADILLNDGAWVLLESRKGVYDRERNHLDLSGEVTLWHDDGTMLVTEEAAVQLGAGSASGDAPVAAQGPFGTLTSDGFRLRDRGQVVVFTGKARAVLEGGR